MGDNTDSVAPSGDSSDGTPVPEGSTTAPPGSTDASDTTSGGADDLPEPGHDAGDDAGVTTSRGVGVVTSDPQVEMAIADLAERLSIGADRISLREARGVTWPDTSLGCPQPGMAYNQVLTPGLMIRLSAGGQMYSYQSGGGREPFLCEQTSVIPEPTPKTDEFVPPPDSEID